MRKALILFLGLLGCGGPDLRGLCEEQEACRGGNEADVEACVVAAELYADLYDEIGCADEFEASVECGAEVSSCQEQAVGACQDSADCGGNARCENNQCMLKFYGPKDNDACEVEQRTLNRCGDLD